MKDLVIFGITHFAKLLKYYIETDDIHQRKVVAFTVSINYIKSSEYLGLPVVPFEKIESFYPPEKYDILLAIGDRKMNSIREHFFYDCKAKGYNVASYYHSSSNLNAEQIGEGNIILFNCYIAPFSIVGNGNLLWDNVTIAHDCIVGDFNTLSGHADTCGFVKIGNNCYLGKHSLINDRVKVLDSTYVGAKAYVKTDTKEGDVIVSPRSETLKNIQSISFVQILESMDRRKVIKDDK